MFASVHRLLADEPLDLDSELGRADLIFKAANARDEEGLPGGEKERPDVKPERNMRTLRVPAPHLLRVELEMQVPDVDLVFVQDRRRDAVAWHGGFHREVFPTSATPFLAREASLQRRCVSDIRPGVANESARPARLVQQRQPSVELPYVDRLLAQLDEEHSAYRRAFGRHVHWGYWPEPARAAHTPDDFAAAAERLTDEICAAAGVRDGLRILDVGCGFGGTIASLNDRLSGVDLTGLNIDDRQLARARTMVVSRPGNRIRFQPGDACALPFTDASFDVVLAVESIFHFRDRRSFFHEVKRVLRPGGCLALSDFVPIRYVHFKSSSFYGPINLRCSAALYRRLAAEVGLAPRVERDVTAQTMPTYRFLRTLERLSKAPVSVRAQTLLLEGLTRLHFLRYMILSFAAGAVREAC